MPLLELPGGHRTARGSMAWTGDEVVVWGQSIVDEAVGTGARWRPGDTRWRPLPPAPVAPIRAFEGTGGSQAVVADTARGRILVRGLTGDDEAAGRRVPPLLAYDPATDRWAVTDLQVPGYRPALAVAGDTLLRPDPDNPAVGPLPPG